MITFLCIVALGLAVYTDAQHRKEQSPLNYREPNRTRGAAEAALKIIEFTDFACQDCAFSHALLDKFYNQFPLDILWTVKYYPTAQLNSVPSIAYAHCVSLQGKFFEFQKTLFQHQGQWRKQENPIRLFGEYAGNMGLDTSGIHNCVEAPSTKQAIRQEQVLAEANLVHMAPTYFINNKMVIGSEELNSYLSGHFGVERKNLSLEEVFVSFEP